MRQADSVGGKARSVAPLNFEWAASLDRNTGVASAYEVSNLPPVISNKCSAVDTKSHGHLLKKKAKSVFPMYPFWLCSKKVTYGFLRAVPIAEEHGGVSIQDSIFHLNLLNAGAPRWKKNESTKHQGKKRRGVNVNERVEVTCEFPITGGLLALPKHSKKECGSIQLSLVSHHKDTASLQRSPATDRGDTKRLSPSYTLESAVVNFRPAIGGAAPVPIVRQWFYLYTQRLVHAYVMRQFHGFCRESLLEQQHVHPCDC